MDYITTGHVRAFQAVRSQLYDDITLSSCRINGEPGVAIIMIDEIGEGKVAVMPLFVGITESMELVFPGKRHYSGSDGGPERPTRSFRGQQAATRPAPR